MSKLEILKKVETIIDPMQEITETEKKVSKIIEDIFRRNVTLESELLNPEDLDLEPERIAELKADLRLITEQTKSVQNRLPETDKADSYDEAIAA